MLFFGNACTKDKLTEPEHPDCDSLTYSTDLKLIIDQSCAYIGCHDGVSEAPGNYENYNGILNHLENGSFENRVFNKFDMPPPPIILTSGQLDSIRCWLETGFLQ